MITSPWPCQRCSGSGVPGSLLPALIMRSLKCLIRWCSSGGWGGAQSWLRVRVLGIRVQIILQADEFIGLARKVVTQKTDQDDQRNFAQRYSSAMSFRVFRSADSNAPARETQQVLQYVRVPLACRPLAHALHHMANVCLTQFMQISGACLGNHAPELPIANF